MKKNENHANGENINKIIRNPRVIAHRVFSKFNAFFAEIDP